MLTSLADADVPSPGSSSDLAKDRKRRVEGGGGLLGGLGRRPGLGGVGGEGGSCCWSSLGMTAGFNRAMEIFSEVPPGRAILKEFSRLSSTR